MSILRCVDALGRSFDVVPGTLCAGFNERGRYQFISSMPDTRLYIDEAAVGVVESTDGLAWLWEPGFYAGEVVAELLDSTGRCVAEYRLDVSPEERKLGRESFLRMVDEIFEFDPKILMGTEAAQSGIGVQGEISDELLEYARLRRYGPGLAAALTMVAAMPLTQLCHERVLRKLHEVRRLDQRSMQKILRNPTALSLVKGGAMSGDGNDQVFFDVSMSYEDMDNPANRALTATLRAVVRRATRVSEALQTRADKESESNTRTSLSPRVPRMRKVLGDLVHSLRRIERSVPFASVTRNEISAAGLNAISAHPVYARAFRHGWYILRPGVIGEIRDESIWISPTWEIYERWCFLKVSQALRDIYSDLTWKVTYPSSRDDCIRMQGCGGAVNVNAWLQVRCPAGDQPSNNDFQSISGERYPDIVVTVEAVDVRRFVVFDAKYRTSRIGVLEGMQSAHVYKDSLRWKQLPPGFALLLVPKGGGAEWLQWEKFRMQQGVGVVQLAGETDVAELARILRGMLD